MLAHLPLISFLIVFVLIFLLRMPIPTGMIAACMTYFLVGAALSGQPMGAVLMGSSGSLHLVAQKPSNRSLPTALSLRFRCSSLPQIS